MPSPFGVRPVDARGVGAGACLIDGAQKREISGSKPSIRESDVSSFCDALMGRSLWRLDDQRGKEA